MHGANMKINPGNSKIRTWRYSLQSLSPDLWFWIFTINTNVKQGKEEFCGFLEWQGELDFSSFLYKAIKELTTSEWYAVSDMNHSSNQPALYGRLWPTVNTGQSETECSFDKIKYYILSIPKKYQILCTAYLKYRSTVLWWTF